MTSSHAGHEAKRPPVDGGLKSVVAALDLLDCFGESETLGVTALAKRLGIGKSSAHRLLTSLNDRGYVTRDPETGRYQLGLHVYALGQLTKNRNQIRQAAMPILEELCQRTGFTVHLAVPETANMIYVERLHAPGRVAHMADVEYSLPAHITSSGKAIAAFNPTLADARRMAGFPAWTPASIQDAERFEAALDEVRRRGFAVNDGEVLTGMTAVAAPVRDKDGRARAAISLVATSAEIQHRVDSVGRIAIAAASQLSRVLEI